jgi:integrase
LELPKEEHRLLANYLSEIEVELLLNQTDVRNPLGIRDRAILETLYSSAIRRNELLNLSIYDVDRNRRLLTIRQGKGKRDRVVPIGVLALEWLEKCIVDVRSWLMEGHGRRRGRAHTQDHVAQQGRRNASDQLIDLGARVFECGGYQEARFLSHASSHDSYVDGDHSKRDYGNQGPHVQAYLQYRPPNNGDTCKDNPTKLPPGGKK